ncbi:MAG: hypothetical protein RBR71_12840 [Gudongella sp.]|nr:hypothetical protein [Gudongella sp.]
MDNILLVIVIIIVAIGLGLMIFDLKCKNNINKAQRDIKQDDKLIPNNRDVDTINSDDVLAKAKELDEQNYYDLSKITDIIMQNSLGQELCFTRPNELLEVKYQEVMVGEATKIGGHLIQSAMPVLERTSTLAEIAKKAPNGLFTATVDPSTLSKFVDGKTTTMVRDTANKLTGHAGFQSIENFSKVNPLLAVNVGMQATAAISGQYYLHQIFDQLDGISSNLEKLIEFHHDEKIGILINAKKRLGEIIQRKNVDEFDIKEIRDLRNKIGEIFQEYKIRLDRERKNIAKFKPETWFVEKRVNNYGKKIDEVSFTIQVCFEADRLSMKAKLVEIAVRMQFNYIDPMLEELFCQLKDNYDNSFSISIDDNIEEIFDSINSNAKKIVGDGKDFVFIDKNPKKLLKYISDKSNCLEKQLNSKTGDNIIYQALSQRNEQQEVLIMIDEELQGQRVFIPVVEK